MAENRLGGGSTVLGAFLVHGVGTVGRGYCIVLYELTFQVGFGIVVVGLFRVRGCRLGRPFVEEVLFVVLDVDVEGLGRVEVEAALFAVMGAGVELLLLLLLLLLLRLLEVLR
jgi:hypothetical protein